MAMSKEAAAVIAKMRARKVNHGKHTSPTLIEWADELESALSASAEPAPYGMTSVHDGMPRAGELVIVYQPDMGDGDRYDFDHIEDGGWAIHNERHEFFLSVGGAGAAGPDMTCVGPSEIAPYTHRSSLPKPEAGQSAAKQPAPPASAEPVAGRDDEIRDLILQYGNARVADNGRGSWQEQKDARDASVSAYSKILDHLELRATPPASVPDGLTVDIFYLAPGDDTFICEVHGMATIGVLSEIEAEIKENPLDEFQAYGQGNYKLRASYFPGQYGEFGRCEIAPGYELDFISYTPIATTPEPRT